MKRATYFTLSLFVIFLSLELYLFFKLDFTNVISDLGLFFSFTALLILLNISIIRDLQANISYFVYLPVFIPALVYLPSFYLGLFSFISTLVIARKLIFIKKLFNVSSNGLADLSTSLIFWYLLHLTGSTDVNIFSIYFLLGIISLALLSNLINSFLVQTVVSLQQGKFDLNGYIGHILALKNSLSSMFLGVINLLVYHYTGLIGVAAFTFLVNYYKPALIYRQVFANELSAYTEFILFVLSLKDTITHQHSERVKNWTELIGKELHLNDEELRELMQSASWHDIGKLTIPDNILNKAGKLTEEEYQLMKSHPMKGYELAKDFHFLKNYTDVIRYHHERYYGKGYPDRLKGERIPRNARIMAIADSFDAMTATRPYRVGMDIHDAVNELVNNAGTQFDPELVEVFIAALKKKYGDNYERWEKINGMDVPKEIVEEEKKEFVSLQ